jgi:CheY-like chemotaxis protein
MTRKILYVEDNPSNVVVVQRVTDKMGFALLVAETGLDGVNMAYREQPDLILMDIGLPDIDGIAATQMLRENQGTSQIPIVAVTAHAMNGDREKCLEAGCNDYVSKPLVVSTLKNILERFIK